MDNNEYYQPNLKRNQRVLEKVVAAVSHPAYRDIFGTLGSLCRRISEITFNQHSAIYVPEGKEDEMLRSVTGCETAFMTEAPSQIVVFNNMMNKLSIEGVFYVLSHELSHFAFLHSSRRGNRDPVLWNIYGDKQINQMLSNVIMPAIYSKIHKNIPSHTRFCDVLKHDARVLFKTEQDYVPFIGYTPDTREWFTRYADEPEEGLYEIGRQEGYSKTIQEQLEHNIKIQQDGSGNQSQSNKGNGHQQGGGEAGESLENLDDLDDENNGNKGASNDAAQSGNAGTNYEYEKSSAADVDNHIQDGLDIRKKLEKEFGEEGKELADKMGLPRTKQEDIRAKERTRVMMQRAQEEARSFNSPVDSFITEAFKRDKESRAQMQFLIMAERAMQKTIRSADWERTEEMDELSRLTRFAEVQQSMGIHGQMLIYEEERVRPEIRILCIADTSGSVMEEEIVKNYLNEMRELIIRYDCEIVLVGADTSSKGEKIVIRKEDLDRLDNEGVPLSGGGGTDMLEPLAFELATAEKRYDMAMVLSDGGAEAFTRDELHATMLKHFDAEKYPNGHTPRNKPYICMLNTRPMYDSTYCEKFGTFSNNEFSMFVLNQSERQRVSVHLSDTSNDFGI